MGRNDVKLFDEGETVLCECPECLKKPREDRIILFFQRFDGLRLYDYVHKIGLNHYYEMLEKYDHEGKEVLQREKPAQDLDKCRQKNSDWRYHKSRAIAKNKKTRRDQETGECSS